MFRLLLVVMLAGAAAGQSFVLQLEEPADVGPIIPQTGSEVVRIPWTLDCGVAGLAERAKITWALPEGPPGITLTGPLSQAVAECPAGESVRGEATFHAQTNLNVPGLVRQVVNLSAEVESGNLAPAQPSSTDNVTVGVTSDYVGLLAVQLATPVHEGRPGTMSEVSFRVNNIGNADSNIRIEASNLTVADREFISRGTTMEISGYYSHLSGGVWTNQKQSVQVTFTPLASSDENREGRPVVMNMVFVTKGTSVGGDEEEENSPALLLAPVAALFIAAGSRARR